MNDRKYVIEIIQRPPEFLSPVAGAVAPDDITARVLLDGLGSINRAVERNLLSLKTGDVTLVLDNDDGYFDNLFKFFGPTDQWMLTIRRGERLQFLGIVVGRGSIRFDRLAKNVEITAYGPTKVMDETSAESVKRTFGTLTMTGVHATGTTTLNMSSTANLLPKDVLHLRSPAGANNEDVTVRYVSSGTQVVLSAALVHNYANGDPIDMKTPYYRYKTVEFLVRALFTAGKIPVQKYLTTKSQFSVAAPTPLSHGGLGTVNFIASAAAERNGRMYAILNTDGSYYQTIGSPDADWVKEDSTLRPWMDWSRYRKQNAGPPNIILRHPNTIGSGNAEWAEGVDDRDPVTKILYRGATVVGPALIIQKATSTDGTTWSAYANVGTGLAGFTGTTVLSCDFDPVRNQCLVEMDDGSHYVYDVGGNTWRAIGQTGGTNNPVGWRYIPELDYFIGSYEVGAVGGQRHFVALRDGRVVYDRIPSNWPQFLRYGSGVGAGYNYMTQGCRYINGGVYFVGMLDNACVFVNTTDDFNTVTAKKVVPNSIWSNSAHGSRVNDSYVMFFYQTNTVADRQYHIAAPFYAGVVAYADFAGQSGGEALSDLAALTNSVFKIDDWLQGSFVARDLISGQQERALDDILLQRNTVHLWDENAQYAKASGNSIEQTAGNADYAAQGIEIDIDMLPNEAFAYALASAYYAFYSKQRRVEEVVVHLNDDHVYEILDRVTIGPTRYLVYESDHDLVNDEATLTLVEDI